MPAGLSRLEFQLFRKYIEDKCGIEITEEKSYLIETRLSGLLVESGLESFNSLYYAIVNNKISGIAEKVIDAITTNETMWFRDKKPWIIFEEILMPKYINILRTGQKSKIRIWSAASSTGQEAYSTAICIDNYLYNRKITDISLSQFEIIATDISKIVIDIAKSGRYNGITIKRGLDTEIRDKYFTKYNGIWELDDRIKNAVTFKQFNLQQDFFQLGNFDLILCRYILIYFSQRLKEEIINKIFQRIHKGGILIIGASEMYQYINDIFETRSYKEGSYYVKKGVEV